MILAVFCAYFFFTQNFTYLFGLLNLWRYRVCIYFLIRSSLAPVDLLLNSLVVPVRCHFFLDFSIDLLFLPSTLLILRRLTIMLLFGGSILVELKLNSLSFSCLTFFSPSFETIKFDQPHVDYIAAVYGLFAVIEGVCNVLQTKVQVFLRRGSEVRRLSHHHCCHLINHELLSCV